MNKRRGAAVLLAAVLVTPWLSAQPGAQNPQPKPGEPPRFGPGGGGPPGGQERKILKDFDKNNDGWLNAEERKAAREFITKERAGKGKGGFGKGGFGKGGAEGAKPGPRVAPADVKNYPDAKLYEPTVLRTLFLEFEDKDWEKELEDFHNTDVEVPCTLTVDGKKYSTVGVHFRGMSSYMGVGAGGKRSLNLALDLADSKQRLYGYKTLNLLNSHGDPAFLSTILYSHIARQYLPAPQANAVKVVINGESWGVYTNVQQFNKEFLTENFKTSKGARWKVRGSPGGRGGLEYFGENAADYKRVFEIKSTDDEKSWQALIELCRVLNKTPADKLEAALEPILDVDGLLWFLALDVALINSDGYWTRASDYSLYRDEKGKFHIIPHDMNEAFRPGGGPGMGGPGGPGGGPMRIFLPPPGELMPPPLQDALRLTDAQRKQLADLQKDYNDKLDKVLTAEQRAEFKNLREAGPGPGGFPPPGGPGGPPPGGPGGPGAGGRGIELDPLVGLDDARKPLRSKVLAVPSLRARYLQHVRTIAEKSLDWKQLGPVVAQYRALLDKEIEADTRKLSTYDAFKRSTADEAGPGAGPGGPPPGGRGPGGGGMPLRAFAEQRSKYLLGHAEVRKVAADTPKR